ncbi:MAG: ATP-binding protein [Rubricoccaceae bacterium]
MPSLFLPSTADAAALAAEFVRHAAKRSGLPLPDAERAAMAAAEAVANAAEHGNGFDASRVVSVEWQDAPGGGQLVVADEGPGPSQARIVAAELPDATATRGRGLYLLRTLADEVRCAAGALRMTFRPGRR